MTHAWTEFWTARRSTWKILVLGLGLLALAVVGCGGSDDDEAISRNWLVSAWNDPGTGNYWLVFQKLPENADNELHIIWNGPEASGAFNGTVVLTQVNDTTMSGVGPADAPFQLVNMTTVGGIIAESRIGSDGTFSVTTDPARPSRRVAPISSEASSLMRASSVRSTSERIPIPASSRFSSM